MSYTNHAHTHTLTFKMVKMVESADEFKALKMGDKPLLVDFTASWCGPCKMIGPYFEELAGKFPGVVFVKVDVDDLDDVAAECGISAMPTFQLYSNGVKVEELTGADKGKLEALAKTADDM